MQENYDLVSCFVLCGRMCIFFNEVYSAELPELIELRIS